MTPILMFIGLAFVGLAVVWPLSYFGYAFYADHVHAEEEKHAKHSGGH